MSRLVVAAALVTGVAPLAGCSTGPDPHPTAAAYLAAWQRGEFAAAGRLTDAPTAATAALTQAKAGLAVAAARLRLGRVRTHSGQARAAYDATLSLRALGDWRYTGALALRKVDGRWRVHWAAADLYPALVAGQRLGRTRMLPARASILDGAGRPLLTPTELVTVSILPSALPDRVGVLTLLRRTLAVDPVRVARLLAAAPPDQLVPVIPLRLADYQRVRTVLHGVPGLRFPVSTRLLAPTASFARALLGRVGPATAEALPAAGADFQAGDEVGLSGLQAAFQRRLAGTPAGSVVVRDAAGTIVRTLATFTGQPGQPVRTTLDRRVQQAAEAALAGVTKPAALVAVRPSDAAIIAVANRPADSAFDRALAGHYPPGSTFKIVTTAALADRGRLPLATLPCPPTLTVQGRTFRNFEGESGAAISFDRAFAISCNTVFVRLAAALGAPELGAAAARLGIGTGWSLPVTSFAGSVPNPRDRVEVAADAIGQGRVSVSPLAMAVVAAAMQNGSWRPPRLVTDPAPTASEAPAVAVPAAPMLRRVMRLVVTSGTAAAAFRSYSGPPVAGKTGTAEYGTANPPATHAWFVGFRGDLAFAVVVEGGGVGGVVAAPLARRFLERL